MFVAAVAVSALPSAAYARDDLMVGGTAVVSGTDGSGLKIRSGPGMSYRVVTTLTEGAKVQVLAGPVSDGNDDWWQISYGASMGWGVERYLDPSGSGSNKKGDEQSSVFIKKEFVARTSAYTNGAGGVPKDSRTATGTKTHWGTVAVDPKVIPLGSALKIEGFDDEFVAEDTGGGIKGFKVDIWMPTLDKARIHGVQDRKVTVVREGPPTIKSILQIN